MVLRPADQGVRLLRGRIGFIPGSESQQLPSAAAPALPIRELLALVHLAPFWRRGSISTKLRARLERAAHHGSLNTCRSCQSRDAYHPRTRTIQAGRTQYAPLASFSAGIRIPIDRFIAWYCSEPRLRFNRTVVVQYRSYLEDLRLSAATINLHLSAIRRLADESTESGF
jgi:hypothetical protein